MKRFLITFLLLASVSGAQTRVGSGAKLQWDITPSPGVTTYNIFESSTSGGQDLTGVPLSTVAHPGNEWPIAVSDGVHFVVLTAQDDVGNKTGPSNEVGFEFDSTPPLPPAGGFNLRIILADGTIVDLLLRPDGSLIDVTIAPVEPQP